MTKHGLEAFELLFVVEGVTEEVALDTEIRCIADHKTNIARWQDEARGYNLTDGGEGVSGWKLLPEQRQALVERNHWRKGLPAIGHSDETRRHLGELKRSRKGRKPLHRHPRKTGGAERAAFTRRNAATVMFMHRCLGLSISTIIGGSDLSPYVVKQLLRAGMSTGQFSKHSTP